MKEVIYSLEVGTVIAAFICYVYLLIYGTIQIIKSLKSLYKEKHRYDKPPTAKCYCKDCVFARKRCGKLECINGISYRNTYNDLNMFCSYGKTAYEYQSTSSSKNQIDSLSNLNK